MAPLISTGTGLNTGRGLVILEPTPISGEYNYNYNMITLLTSTGTGLNTGRALVILEPTPISGEYNSHYNMITSLTSTGTGLNTERGMIILFSLPTLGLHGFSGTMAGTTSIWVELQTRKRQVQKDGFQAWV